jgi:hypothetical protein
MVAGRVTNGGGERIEVPSAGASRRSGRTGSGIRVEGRDIVGEIPDPSEMPGGCKELGNCRDVEVT